MKHKVRSLAAAAGLLGGVLMAAPPALASSSATGKYCVANVETHRVTCANTQAEELSIMAGTVTLAILYDGKGYTGAALRYVGPHGCSTTWADTDYQDPSFDNPFWNNRFSSVRTYNHCDVRLFGRKNFRGAHSTWIDQSSNLAAIGTGWSNRTSSIKFS